MTKESYRGMSRAEAILLLFNGLILASMSFLSGCIEWIGLHSFWYLDTECLHIWPTEAIVIPAVALGILIMGVVVFIANGRAFSLMIVGFVFLSTSYVMLPLMSLFSLLAGNWQKFDFSLIVLNLLGIALIVVYIILYRRVRKVERSKTE